MENSLRNIAALGKKPEPSAYLTECTDLVENGTAQMQEEVRAAFADLALAQQDVQTLTKAGAKLDVLKKVLREAKYVVDALDPNAVKEIYKAYNDAFIDTAKGIENRPSENMEVAKTIAKLFRDSRVLAQRLLAPLQAAALRREASLAAARAHAQKLAADKRAAAESDEIELTPQKKGPAEGDTGLGLGGDVEFTLATDNKEPIGGDNLDKWLKDLLDEEEPASSTKVAAPVNTVTKTAVPTPKPVAPAAKPAAKPVTPPTKSAAKK